LWITGEKKGQGQEESLHLYWTKKEATVFMESRTPSGPKERNNPRGRKEVKED